MSPIQQMLLGAGAVAEKRYIDDIFSQFLYAGNGSSQSINNGIDLAGEGGMILLKSRDSADASGGGSPAGYGWGVHDTVRGKTKNMQTQSTAGESTWPNAVSSFNSNGFTLGDVSYNYSSQDFISFSFRKARGFFDCVTYVGDGVADRAVAHSLGSLPGCIIVKSTDTGNPSAWSVWHRSLWNTTDYKSTQLNTTGAKNGWNAFWSVSAPTSSNFYVRHNGANVDGQTYVAYIFAHDEQSFGDAGNSSVIKCGSYTGGSAGLEVDLGWEPQFLLLKNADTVANWWLASSMTGMRDVNGKWLAPNGTYAEGSLDFIQATSKGFKLRQAGSDETNGNGDLMTYVAIRFPDGLVSKPPTLGTDVFAMDTGAGSSTIPNFDSGFRVDWALYRKPDASYSWHSATRMTGTKWLQPNSTTNQGNDTAQIWDSNAGWFGGASWADSTLQSWMWKRHAGFDVVGYDGVGGGQTLNHNLGKIPEMIWIKNRDYAEPWTVGHKGLNGGTNPWQYWVRTNASDAEEDNTASFNDTAPTATQFTVGNDRRVDFASQKFIALLFSSVENISKCGFYDGSENAQTITVGFQPRFILIKRTTSGAGGDDWVVADSVRGISAGNDEILYLNLTDEQASQNLVGVTSTGFTVVADYHEVNHEDHKYIYYCHA